MQLSDYSIYILFESSIICQSFLAVIMGLLLLLKLITGVETLGSYITVWETQEVFLKR